jgi:acyl-CoA synthetase (AMP-forming)/AMP-acid ligase II
VPVIEAYGMTEAAHQVASNPLPPGVRKPGCVGLPAGPAVAVREQDGQFLGVGARGEVVIRGPSVMRGYESPSGDEDEALAAGWLRTGDEGFIDAQGYLTLTGRLKEQINRGGEKVSPFEVDVVLHEHEAVSQAVTFAVPDRMLGEEVAAAVVLKPGCQASARAIRNHCSQYLADYKVPRRIYFVSDIPKSGTGKVQRRELARLLEPEGRQPAMTGGSVDR